MERDARFRERLQIGLGAVAGAVALTALTLVFWRVFEAERNADVDFGIMFYTLPKGAMLGGASAYVLRLFRTERADLGAKVCIALGALVMLIFGIGGLDNIRTSLQWDGFTALWGLVLLVLGGRSFYRQMLAKAVVEQKMQ